MIQLNTIKQTIQIRGTTSPQLKITTAPSQSIRLTSSGPQGPQGVAGPAGPQGASIQGPPGPPGETIYSTSFNGGFF